MCSRNSYRALSEHLELPTRNTIFDYFGKLGQAGSLDECVKTVKKLFESLNEGQRKSFISFDEIHIKPGLHCQGKYVLGEAVNQDSHCPATKILAIMVNPSFGAPAFVARLIPVHNIQADFLYDQLTLLITTIHDVGGFVYALMSDNLRVNQKTFRLFHENFSSRNIYSIPVPNEVFRDLYILYDPTHLFKNIRNNWVTEKTQTLEFWLPDTDDKVLVTRYRR